MAAVVLTAACTPSQIITVTTLPGIVGSEVSGLVTRIHDGDTIDVETEDGNLTVRLIAVNTPDQGECYADLALDHLIDTLKDADVELEMMGTDQFGRALAHVFTEGRHINLELVRMGLGLASTPEADDRHREAILAAEESAFMSGTGLWGRRACGSEIELPALHIHPESSTPDPPGPDDESLSSETVVIVNEGDTIVDLSGWVLRDESTRHRFTFGDATTLGPGQRLEISSDDPNWSPGGSPVWNNDGDMALLQDGSGTVVSRWRY